MFKFHLTRFKSYLAFVKPAILLPSLLLLSSMNSTLQAQTLKLGTGEFPPYISSNLNRGGALTHIVTSAFTAAGYESTVEFIPWTRAYKLADNMRIDGTFAWSIKVDRQVSFLYSKPLFIFEQKAFALKHKTVNVSDSAVKDSVNLCRPQGYAIQGFSKNLIGSGVAKHFAPPDVETCFNMLKAGRVDVVVVDKLEGQNYVARQFSNIDDVKVLDKTFYKYSNHLLISKKHPQAKQLMKDFDMGLDKIMETGEYQTILYDELGL